MEVANSTISRGDNLTNPRSDTHWSQLVEDRRTLINDKVCLLNRLASALQLPLYTLGTQIESPPVGAPPSARWTRRRTAWQPPYRGEGAAPTPGLQLMRRSGSHQMQSELVSPVRTEQSPQRALSASERYLAAPFTTLELDPWFGSEQP